MNCPSCNETLTGMARFCSRCGSAVTSEISAGETIPHNDAETMKVETDRPVEDPLIGSILETKYLLVEKLGEGGMGTVYRATRVHIGDEAAVKVLHPRYVRESAALERFRREARSAAKLRHPNIVTIYDYGEARSEYAPAFIVMELVHGTSLREILESQGRLSCERGIALMRSICSGVGAAHRAGIVHRDLKPDNIMVKPPDVEGEPESATVLDFGIAKLRDAAAEHALTLTGTVIGTPYYMSPEQCRAEQLDARSDVYSLGAMLYEMLSGRPPFTAPTPTGVVAKHLTEAAPPLPDNLGVSPTLESIILRALSKDPNSRQADAASFGRDLAGLHSSSAPPIPIPPETRQGEMWIPPASRHGHPATGSRAPLFAFVSALVVLLLIGAVVAFWMFTPNDGKPEVIATQPQAPSEPETRPASPSTEVVVPQQQTAPPPVQPPAPEPQSDAPLDRDFGALPQAFAAVQRAEAMVVQGRQLLPRDVARLSLPELRLLRNTVYARHGRTFQNPALQSYFDSRGWYRPRAEYSDSDLTQVDRRNVQLILAAERRY